MEDLTVRQKFILKTLLEKGPFNIKDLSNLMDVSERTIMREIASINNNLKKYKAVIIEDNGQIILKGEEEALDKIHASLGAIPLQWLLTPEQRQILMTIQLLLSEEPIKAAYFSYQFNVVEGTISLYLDKIEEWLKMRNLSLIRRRGYGIKVEGSELDKRNAIVELFYNYKPIEELLAFVYNDEKDKYVYTFFSTVFDNELVQLVKRIVQQIKNVIHDHLSDLNYFGMFIHLLVSIYRTKIDKPIQLNDEFVKDILLSNEFIFMKDVEKILKENEIYLPDAELAYLAIHLSPKKYVYKQNRFEELGISLQDLSKEVVEEVSRLLNIKINCDEQLIVGLSQHFEPALYRLTMGLQTTNPLVEEIKNYYGDLFKAVNRACKLIFSKYNLMIPEEEIGYITMHIGAAIERQQALSKKLRVFVICPNGMGTARILSAKLKTLFREIDAIDIGSIWEYKKKSDDYDLIISTVKLEDLKDNVIVVSPFLTEEDIKKVEEFIEKYAVKKEKELPGNLPMVKKRQNFEIADEILRNLQLKYVEAKTIADLIKFIAKDLYDLMLTEDAKEIEELIFKREAMGNVVIPNTHIALIHTRSDKMVMPFVGVYKLKTPLKMKSVGFSYEEVDTFLVMLARKTESSEILEMLGKISISLIEDKAFNEILRFGDIKDIRNSLVKILNDTQEALEDE
ncbi:transcriptional regulator MtlR [Thermoanaerobacter kivui]|uniref:Transcriptional regulator MtlR n=2 Tax=Thermoanaerobacter kivui TaxID=2325 RepID=A0A097ANT1_THEKI|nr:transcriptional regulator MtlR [Thermoanaerobacter kivui]